MYIYIYIYIYIYHYIYIYLYLYLSLSLLSLSLSLSLALSLSPLSLSLSLSSVCPNRHPSGLPMALHTVTSGNGKSTQEPESASRMDCRMQACCDGPLGAVMLALLPSCSRSPKSEKIQRCPTIANGDKWWQGAPGRNRPNHGWHLVDATAQRRRTADRTCPLPMHWPRARFGKHHIDIGQSPQNI